MADLQQLTATCAQMFKEGRDTEDVLIFLRQSGCGKLDSIKALVKLKGINVMEARRTIHFSKTWEDTRQQDEEFETAFWEELNRQLEEMNNE